MEALWEKFKKNLVKARQNYDVDLRVDQRSLIHHGLLV